MEVVVSLHAKVQAMERFAIADDEEARQFLLDELKGKRTVVPTNGGAWKYICEHAELIVGYRGGVRTIVTCYPLEPVIASKPNPKTRARKQYRTREKVRQKYNLNTRHRERIIHRHKKEQESYDDEFDA